MTPETYYRAVYCPDGEGLSTDPLVRWSEAWRQEAARQRGGRKAPGRAQLWHVADRLAVEVQLLRGRLLQYIAEELTDPDGGVDKGLSVLYRHLMYDPPTPAELRALLSRWSLTGAAAGTAAGVTARQIRRYTGGDQAVPYGVLFTLAVKMQGVMISPPAWREELGLAEWLAEREKLT